MRSQNLRFDDCRVALLSISEVLIEFTCSICVLSLQKVIFLKNYSSVLYKFIIHFNKKRVHLYKFIYNLLIVMCVCMCVYV